MENQKNGEIVVYVGTYTIEGMGTGEGIYVYRSDLSSGALTYQSQVSDVVNPSFFAIHPAGHYLVCGSRS